MSTKPVISVVLGTRPEAIKLAPVILALRSSPDIDCNVCVTGQHREMLDQVLDVFGIEPDIDLRLMRHNQSLAELSARAIEAVDKYLKALKPDLLLVQGDTTTVFCASLAAFYNKVPVGHVEAGLRTGDILTPWPEEANRVLTTRIAALHFAPTAQNANNLINEGVSDSNICITGNTVIDALYLGLDIVKRSPQEINGLPDGYLTSKKKFVLVTGHRRENFGGGFENICMAIKQLAAIFPNVDFIYPVHLNPNVREPVERILGSGVVEGQKGLNKLGNVFLIDPLPYLQFVALMEGASAILTDSGGVQEEAPSLGKHVIVMRESTERPEGLEGGLVRLVGTNKERIVDEVSAVLRNCGDAKLFRKPSPYGDGKSSERIVDACRQYLRGNQMAELRAL